MKECELRLCRFDPALLGERMVRRSSRGYGQTEFAPAPEVYAGGGQ